MKQFKHAPLSQQIATAAAALCLAVSLALVALAAISSGHMLREQQAHFGRALARQVAAQVGLGLETGDLLSVRATAQRFVDTTAAEQVAIIDVEGKPLGEAGRPEGLDLYTASAPITVEANIAGEARVTVSTDAASAAQRRFVLSLLGLAVVLSLAVYGAGMQLGRVLGARLGGLSRRLTLEDAAPGQASGNELLNLQQRVDALPMDLLRTRDQRAASEEHYSHTAVLYLQLDSLADYVDTLDEQSLHRYIERLHRLVYTAAGFYGGEIQVARQFALAVYFTGESKGGSAAFRAASCAWLVRAAARELDDARSLSLRFFMAVGLSELGIGDSADIYPGLYMQSTLDELQQACASRPPQILLSPAVCADTDVDGRLQHHATEVLDYAMLEAVAGPYGDLLERQLQLILKRQREMAPGR
ncbi:hypothetical protein E4634_13870 [Mangrovimicrobium sediminis]|uniref:GGDEF domain-containing protein n=1 Tax=Mangrovimicrobium sediminis TaxID=2562682 RepID=A0A4Z0LZM4_9GAMM|nr:hypothetical protein [Haliea sp. SAOS-164]TGD72607.1 hypothetical protein E4634_13870 [Haliea sp. SAOS-164]